MQASPGVIFQSFLKFKVQHLSFSRWMSEIQRYESGRIEAVPEQSPKVRYKVFIALEDAKHPHLCSKTLHWQGLTWVHSGLSGKFICYTIYPNEDNDKENQFSYGF